MFNFSESDTVREIVSRQSKIMSDLKDGQLYFSHIVSDRAEELLKDHQCLVNQYLVSVVESTQLDGVINTLIDRYIDDCGLEADSLNVKKYVKQLFCDAVIFHDFGKINENFQAHSDKMNNPAFHCIKSPIETKHALLSKYLYVAYHLSEVNKGNYTPAAQVVFIHVIFSFAYIISKHHASELHDPEEEKGFEEETLSFMERYLSCFCWDVEEPFRTKLLERNLLSSKMQVHVRRLHKRATAEFSLYGLLKLAFSLLTASDYLATMHYMNGWTTLFDEYGLLNKKQKKRIIKNVESTQAYNRAVYEQLPYFEMLSPQTPNKDNLNRLRSEMAVEVIRNVRTYLGKNIFYIEAPTGGGKTNLSMITLAELLKDDIESGRNKINKVFYVFPFTTLITQTYAALKKTLGLDDTEIIELHSKAGFREQDDDRYGGQYKCYLDNLFVNFPIVVTSHVKFFDVLKSNRKEINYLLHRIANSVVIIDELQSYAPDLWDKLIYLIDNYAESFNIKFILMSATLPKIGKLACGKDVPEIISLIPDKQKYFQNPNFKGRVKFDFSLLKWIKPRTPEEKSVYLEQLCGKVFEESRKYQANAGRVFTIIEFIFKRTASDFCKISKEVNDGFFDHIFVLSGTILEPRRKEIITFLRDKNNAHKNILLITTQVVEAGVDIDMDLGFKDKSLVDSDEQLAGRVNRNVAKGQCTLFIFDCDKEVFVYGRDKRYEVFKEMGASAIDEYKAILNGKDFDRLYDVVINNKNLHNNGMLNIGISDFRNHVQNLDFSRVNDDFILIGEQNYPVFVQIKIPVQIPGSAENNFSENELLFLQKNGAYLKDDCHVEGKNVWNLYKEIIQSKSDHFLDQKIRMRRIQGILSKFTFSLFAQSKDMQHLIDRGYKDEDLGYIYLHDIEKDDHDTIYSYESGLNDEKMNGALIF